MTTTTIRISTDAREKLHAMAEAEGKSMQWVLEKAVELYRRQQVLLAANAAYASLRESEPAWNEIEVERSTWDATLADGLEPY